MDTLIMYMSLLTLYENNMRAEHWNLAGTGFDTAHLRYGGYYEKLGEMLDETAEIIISLGGTPVLIKQAMEHAANSEIEVRFIDPAINISVQTADAWTAWMFKQLYGYATALANMEDLPVDVQDTFMAHAKYFRIEGMYKLARAATEPTAINPEE